MAITFSEIVDQAREYNANQQWLSLQKSQPCHLLWEDCARVVLSWTDIPPAVLSVTDVSDFLTRVTDSPPDVDYMLVNHRWL